MTDVIHTDRLELRSLRPDDAEALFALFANWEVVQWLSTPPWPYTMADAQSFLAELVPQNITQTTFAIMREGALMGGIDVRIRKAGAGQSAPGPHLGYWLGQPYWGQGFMTEAARAFVAHVFAAGLGDTIYSGAFSSNVAKLRIQEKLGFVRNGAIMVYARSQDKELPHINTKLTRAAFRTESP